MSDYIKKEDVENIMLGSCDESALWKLRHLPSADVVEVKHGRWKEYGVNNDNTHNIACSICGHEIKSRGHANSVYTELKYRYCPYCGAKMDEKEQEHE